MSDDTRKLPKDWKFLGHEDDRAVYQDGEGELHYLAPGESAPASEPEPVQIGSGMTWPQIIDAFAATLPPEQRAGMAARILEGTDYMVTPNERPIASAPRNGREFFVPWRGERCRAHFAPDGDLFIATNSGPVLLKPHEINPKGIFWPIPE